MLAGGIYLQIDIPKVSRHPTHGLLDGTLEMRAVAMPPRLDNKSLNNMRGKTAGLDGTAHFDIVAF